MKIHPLVEKKDLPGLPKELQQDFRSLFVPILQIEPHRCQGLPCHKLERELKGWQALEIDECGVAYRLVYRIYDMPGVMRVDIESFDVHDPAYEKAKERTYKQRISAK